MDPQKNLMKKLFEQKVFLTNLDFAKYFKKSKSWADSVRSGRKNLTYRRGKLLEYLLQNKIIENVLQSKNDKLKGRKND